MRIVKNDVFVAAGQRSKIDVDFLSNEIEVALLLFYLMGLKLTSSCKSATIGHSFNNVIVSFNSVN